MMKSTRRALLCAGLIAAAPAVANQIEKLAITGLEDLEEAPVIRVISDQGERWNRVDPAYQTLVKVRLDAECQYAGRNNAAYEGVLQAPGMLPAGETRPTSDQIPTTLTSSRLFTWGDGAGQGFDPVAACNTMMDQEVANAQAPTKYHVLANGLTLTARDQFAVNYNLTCNRVTLDKTVDQTVAKNITAKIVCAGSDDAARRVGPLVATGSLLRVDEVRIEQTPNAYFGDCPVAIKIGGVIKASAPGRVTYQIVSDDGWQSETYQLEFQRAGVQPTVELNRNIGIDSDGWMQINVLSPPPAQVVRAPFSVNCR